MKQDKLRLTEEKDGLEIQSQKLAEESYYAKELAAAAAVELKNLAEEVTRLSYENAKLVADFTPAKELTASVTRGNDTKRRDQDNGILVEEMQKELVASCQREAALEDTLSQKARRENELLKIIDDAKCHEHDLENELENMWALVSKIKKESSQDDLFEFKSKENGFHSSKTDTGRILSDMEASDNWKWDGISTLEEAKAAYNFERRRCKELENAMSRLKVILLYFYRCNKCPLKAGYISSIFCAQYFFLLETCLEPHNTTYRDDSSDVLLFFLMHVLDLSGRRYQRLGG